MTASSQLSPAGSLTISIGEVPFTGQAPSFSRVDDGTSTVNIRRSRMGVQDNVHNYAYI